MTLQELRDSGLLELYVMGQTTEAETNAVLAGLQKFPQLKNEMQEIEAALYQFARMHQRTPSEGVREELLKKARLTRGGLNERIKRRQEAPARMKAICIALSILSAACLAFIFISRTQLSELQQAYDQKLLACDSIEQVQNAQLALLENIADRNNIIIPINATEKYPATQLYFYNNEVTQKGYIQVYNLPAIADNQSFQLWSLKGNDPPVPLDVFSGDTTLFFEVSFIENSDAYAITIEPEGGSQVPTLDELVGVFPVS